MKIKDRIVDFQRVKASELHPHPKNWRSHPDSQRDALKGVLAEIGYADALVVRKNGDGFQILDGHLRAETTPDAKVPILVTDLNDEEADKFLVTHDPLGALATSDAGNLEGLLKSVETDSDALAEMLDSLSADVVIDSDFERGWNPERFEDAEGGDGIKEKVGYSLGSFWKDIKSENARNFVHYITLPPTEKLDGIRAISNGKYGRTNFEEIERVVLTYMREGDVFCELCCGWATFASAAKYWGYSGKGIDIWTTAVNHSRLQLDKMPGDGSCEVIEGDALRTPYEDDEFDFIYCNPPFFNQERYGDMPENLCNANGVDDWCDKIKQLTDESYRITKPGGLAVFTMNDFRIEGKLFFAHSAWDDCAISAGYDRHDFVVAEVVSQRLRLRKKDYKLRRTVKCHEYVMVYRKKVEA